jgi:hypothetical protein
MDAKKNATVWLIVMHRLSNVDDGN